MVKSFLLIRKEGLSVFNSDLSSPVVTEHRTLKFIYTNLDGISNKKSELSSIVFNEKPDIICLTETKTSEKGANDHTYDCENYEVIRKDRLIQRTPGGGVSILVSF